ncbi:MAG: hypothetical protein COT84_05800 [Chlamydiae bacterium CG10_big_fil_rev_8_21_14_0_10_35_9]|nr:MAG: hypothetical protein COT84_05800 [Chlamydiae bacterium CG10_big_fil_rev_8_21_14_0_10_35_9]
MKFQTKALYNLLRLNYMSDPTISCESWQVEDMRKASTEDLYHRLEILGIELTKESLWQLSEGCDTPEELTDALLEGTHNAKIDDQCYLLIFELWRRFLPEKQSLSIFCDELDLRIFRYEHNELQSDEEIQDALANLEDILDENVDMGVEPSETFARLSEYLAHDLEGFLYDYIAEQVDADNYLYAQELLEEFYPFMTELVWFDFIRLRLLSLNDIAASNELAEKIIKELKKSPNLDLQLEILRFMAETGDRSLFLQLVKNTLKILKKEEDFLDLLEVIADFYRRLDQEDVEKAIQTIMNRRQAKQPLEKINLKDPDIKKLKLVLH